MKLLEWSDWTDIVLTQSEKQAVENIHVDYHDNVARYSMDFEMNTEFKVKLTAKDDKAVYSQSLPKPIHLKEDLVTELAPMQKMGSSRCFPSRSMQVPFLQRENPTENYISLCIQGRSISWLQVLTLTTIIQRALCPTQHNIWQGSLFSASLTAPKLITVCRWRTNSRWNCLHSVLPGKILPIKELHKVLADLWLLFQASCASTWTRCQSWTMCLTRGRYWNCEQHCYGSYPANLGSLQAHLLKKIEIHNWKVSFWSKTGWIPRQNHIIRKSITTNS